MIVQSDRRRLIPSLLSLSAATMPATWVPCDAVECVGRRRVRVVPLEVPAVHVVDLNPLQIVVDARYPALLRVHPQPVHEVRMVDVDAGVDDRDDRGPVHGLHVPRLGARRHRLRRCRGRCSAGTVALTRSSDATDPMLRSAHCFSKCGSFGMAVEDWRSGRARRRRPPAQPRTRGSPRTRGGRPAAATTSTLDARLREGRTRGPRADLAMDPAPLRRRDPGLEGDDQVAGLHADRRCLPRELRRRGGEGRRREHHDARAGERESEQGSLRSEVGGHEAGP